MTFVGIDVGSSSIKGAVLDLDSFSVGKTARVPCPEPITGLPPRHFELDPMAVVAAVQDVLVQLVPGLDDCQGIVSCSQMAGVVLVDGNGDALTNYLSWRDQRALDPHPLGQDTYYGVLQQRVTDEGMQQLGHECKLGSSPSLLFWLAEQNRLPRNAIPVTLGDYVLMRLCGSGPITEYTNALGAINLETLSWHRAALDSLGIGDLEWPRLCKPHGPIGELKLASLTIPCYPAVGDHQCALAGSSLRPGELSINVSTGSQVSRLADSYQAGPYQVRPYFDRQYLYTLTHLPAGRSLNTLVELLSELPKAQGLNLDDPWAYVDDAAADVDTDLAVDLAFFDGPMGQSGSISNLKVDNLSVGSLFRAAFRNMADNYQRCARRLSPHEPWDGVVLSGGLVQKCDVLRESIARRFNCPSRVSAVAEDTFTGLLVLALVASGRANSVAAAAGSLAGLMADDGGRRACG